MSSEFRGNGFKGLRKLR